MYTMSTGAYSQRWKLVSIHAPLVPAVPAAAAHVRETLDLREAVDAVCLVGARVLDAVCERALARRVVVAAVPAHARGLVYALGDLVERLERGGARIGQVADQLRPPARRLLF